MPARINKTTVAEILQSIRREVARNHLVIKSQPTEPERVAQRQELLLGLKESLNKKIDKLDVILTLNTRLPES